eukprot:14295620-Alexandrium_andersonii.AAC.1
MITLATVEQPDVHEKLCSTTTEKGYQLRTTSRDVRAWHACKIQLSARMHVDSWARQQPRS